MPAKRSAAPSHSRRGRTEILLEEIKAQNRATIEAVFALEERLTARSDERHQELKERIEVLEQVVTKHSQSIAQLTQSVGELTAATAANTAEIASLKAAIERLEQKLDGKADRSTVEAIELRLSVLERKFGI